jgi:hypothetical protein
VLNRAFIAGMFVVAGIINTNPKDVRDSDLCPSRPPLLEAHKYLMYKANQAECLSHTAACTSIRNTYLVPDQKVRIKTLRGW